MNARFTWHFPKEAYMFLWYFVEVCPFGIIFDKYDLLQYLALVDVRPRKKGHKQLYKWLSLFGSSAFWRSNLRPEGNSINGVRGQRYIFIQFECVRRLITEEDGLIVDKKYSCKFYHHEDYSVKWPERQHKVIVCEANNIQPNMVPQDLHDPDHPDIRLHKRPPQRFYKKLPGQDCRVLISSGSDESSDDMET
ncbi:hypothetical protein POM88_045503 [Heracleum sosnowskyi]|uniref:Uncharacterized protein n=1 Tax=Heracleum sosnowskyi TaxID=360622 RepID=A0AAD8H5T4_9APIA|nr:hypothetical protein POM88_045503 [Heracleum sosnowskyi]